MILPRSIFLLVTKGIGWDDSIEVLAGTDPKSSSSAPIDANDNGIPDILEVKAEGVSETEIPTWAYILLIVAIIAALLVSVLLMRRRGGKGLPSVEQDAGEAEIQKNPPPPPKESPPPSEEVPPPD